jgi:hypothetical protein
METVLTLARGGCRPGTTPTRGLRSIWGRRIRCSGLRWLLGGRRPSASRVCFTSPTLPHLPQLMARCHNHMPFGVAPPRVALCCAPWFGDPPPPPTHTHTHIHNHINTQPPPRQHELLMLLAAWSVPVRAAPTFHLSTEHHHSPFVD